jgi:Zn-dependent protease
VVARLHGIRVNGVVLFMFGGVSQIAHDPTRPSTELSVALAGPCVSLLIAAAGFWLEPLMPTADLADQAAAALVHYLASVNLGLVLFNLLPGFPLDGGRVVRALIWRGTGDPRAATRIASRLGVLLGFGLMGLGIWLAVRVGLGGGLWYILLGWFLRDAALASDRMVRPAKTA